MPSIHTNFLACSAVPESDLSFLLAGWQSVRQCLSLLTSLSASLCNQINSFWHQQSQQLCSKGSTVTSHVLKLTQLGNVLPLLVTMLADIGLDSGSQYLQSMTFQDSIALHLQLLISNHQPSQAVQTLLHQVTFAQAQDAHAISTVWETTVCTVQVSMTVCDL